MRIKIYTFNSFNENPRFFNNIGGLIVNVYFRNLNQELEKSVQMTENDPKNSVQNEQFGNSEDTNADSNNENDTESHSDSNDSLNQETENNENISEPSPAEEKEEEKKNEAISEPVDAESEATSEEKPVEDSSEATNESVKVNDVTKENVEEQKAKEESTEVKSESEESVEETVSTEQTSESSLEETENAKPVESESKTEESKQDETVKLPNIKDVDYTQFENDKLVDLFSEYLSQFSIDDLREHVDAIKSVFYKKLNKEIEDKKSNFLKEGGKIEDFKVEESPIELKMKDLLNLFREKRNELNKSLESQKDINLQTKYDIIESIKELINSQESLNKTFQDFRNLQERWREVGPVPQKNVKDLWESYHYHVEAFYDYIKINKELRDLDFKKNLDSKIALCEKAEELLLEPSVVEAFRNLQVLHDQWREIGPVPADKRAELWDRFRDATSKINHRHQEYFVNLKEEQKNNLKEKTLLCEKAEELSELVPESAKEWEEKSKEIIELQKIWKTIGFAPKKHNTKIYERFRAACDKFFDKKRDYFAHNREEQENNLQLKTELCMQAEGIKDSTDWKKTTDELIKLQKRWKTIGPVPIKQSDKVWKRFRAACDTFFNNKSKFYENIDSKYEENLKLKEKLIDDIKNFTLGDDVESNLAQLKDFQRKWSEIGFVPIKQKDAIQETYRQTINDKFDHLKLDEDKKSLLKFRSRIESIASKPNADRRLAMERDKCYNKLKQLENDIILWENNIGFFSNSKNAESMITDVEQKISNAKKRMESLNEKIQIIDEFDV